MSNTNSSTGNNQHEMENPVGRDERIRYATPFMVALDWLMIVLYFALLSGLTWWSVSRSRNTADDYFLAGRDLGWLVVGASIFELAGGREFKPAMKAGVGATLGLFAGAVGKLLCCGAMMVLFISNVIWRSLH